MRNRGELAEGWYDPNTLQKAQASVATNNDPTETQKTRQAPAHILPRSEESSDEDLLGPSLPSQDVAMYERRNKQGPGIPNLQDLELQRG